MIITGTVMEGSDDEARPSSFGFRPAVVRAGSIVRGADPQIREIRVNPAVGSTCYFPMKRGQRWLIFGGFGRDGISRTNLCSGSKPLISGDLMEAFVQSHLAGPNLVGGTVRRFAMSGAHTVASGTEVRLTGPDERVVQTTPDGVFTFWGLQPGEYQVSVRHLDLSAGTRSRGREADLGTFEVRERGCVEMPVTLYINQSIRGTLRSPKGTAVAGVAVAAYRLDRRGGAPLRFRETRTNASGDFELPRLENGTYIVGAGDEPGDDPQSPEVHYHPRGVSLQRARRIVLDGQGVSRIDIAGDPPRLAEVSVTVAAVDGKPLDSALVLVRRDGVRNRDHDRETQRWTTADGTLDLRLYEGHRYRFSSPPAIDRPGGWASVYATVNAGTRVELRLSGSESR